MEINEALNQLSHDRAVDARLVVLIEYVELVLGGAEGLSYSEGDRDDLRRKILQLLAVRWTQGRQEEDERLGATDDGTRWTTMPTDAPPQPSHSPEKRRRGLYAVPAPGPSPTPPEAQ
jgi:hypothetical protein